MIKKLLEKENFDPSFIGIFVNPFFLARRGLLKGIKSFAPNLKGKLLDVGCGTKPYEKFFDVQSYIGLEIDTTINKELKKADFFYDGKTFPFESCEFDSVITNQVLEHVFNPTEFISELNRVLKTGGKLLITVPFVWDEHEQPYDYARYSSFGLKHLFESNGFKIISQYKSNPDAGVICQLINAYLYKVVRGIPVIKQITTIFVMSIFNLLGLLFSKILPDNEDLYLDNIMIAQKVSDCYKTVRTN